MFSAAFARRNDGDGAATLPPDLRRGRPYPRRVATFTTALAWHATTTPSTMSPTALAAGDFDVLFLVATRPSGDSDDDRDDAAANGVGGCGGGGGMWVDCTYILVRKF